MFHALFHYIHSYPVSLQLSHWLIALFTCTTTDCPRRFNFLPMQLIMAANIFCKCNETFGDCQNLSVCLLSVTSVYCNKIAEKYAFIICRASLTVKLEGIPL